MNQTDQHIRITPALEHALPELPKAVSFDRGGRGRLVLAGLLRLVILVALILSVLFAEGRPCAGEASPPTVPEAFSAGPPCNQQDY